MSDDLKTLASLSEEEKQKLLDWYKEIPEGEAELDKVTQTPQGAGAIKWNENPAMVTALEAFLQALMGPTSKYQFANLTHLYSAYRSIQDKHAPFCNYLGREELKFFIRKWIMKNGVDWEEKSTARKNRVKMRLQYGHVSHGVSGFGKRQLIHDTLDGPTFVGKIIEYQTVWNGDAFNQKQPRFEKPDMEIENDNK
jgi:hypothetical protein